MPVLLSPLNEMDGAPAVPAGTTTFVPAERIWLTLIFLVVPLIAIVVSDTSTMGMASRVVSMVLIALSTATLVSGIGLVVKVCERG